MSTPNQPNGTLVPLLSSILQLLTDDTGRISFKRVVVTVIIGAMFVVGNNARFVFDEMKDFLHFTSNESYIRGQEDKRIADLEASIKTQSQMIYSMTGSDMVAIWTYKPENLHHFRELIHYEGALPDGTTAEDYQNIGVDKTTKEYRDHITGIPYQSNGLEHTLSSITNTRYYVYSCPLFNARGAYSGVISMYWKEIPDVDERLYFVQCYQSARAIGQNM